MREQDSKQQPEGQTHPFSVDVPVGSKQCLLPNAAVSASRKVGVTKSLKTGKEAQRLSFPLECSVSLINWEDN